MAGTNLFSLLPDGAYGALADDQLTSVNAGLVYLAKCTGTPPTTANLYAHGCLMNQTDSGTGTNALYQNTGSSASPVWTLLDTSLPGDSASKLIDTNSLTVVDVATVASQVNHLRVTPSATGAVSANAVLVSPVGDDAAVSVQLAPKGATGITTIGLATGTGDVVVGSSSATQAVKIGDGAGAATVNVANTTTAGATVNVATGAGTNQVNIGSSAGTSETFINGGNGPSAVVVGVPNTGVITVGGSSQSGDLVLGSSTVGQSVKIADGTGAPVVNIANNSTDGATISVAGAATTAGNADVVNIGTGNAATTGAKRVNILTGTPADVGGNTCFIGGSGGETFMTVFARTTAAAAINVAEETGSSANNALVAQLFDASGAQMAVQGGLRITLPLDSHTLQAGANTLDLNGAGAASIKSHFNIASDIGTAYAVGSILDLVFDGTVWQDMSQ